MQFVFKALDGEIIVPDNFYKASKFLKDYIKLFSLSNKRLYNEDDLINNKTTFSVPDVNVKQLQIIFDLVEHIQSDALCIQTSDDEMEKLEIKTLPGWAYIKLKVINRDDLIVIANTSKFLAIETLTHYILLFYMSQITESSCAREICEFMNLKTDESNELLPLCCHSKNWDCTKEVAVSHDWCAKTQLKLMAHNKFKTFNKKNVVKNKTRPYFGAQGSNHSQNTQVYPKPKIHNDFGVHFLPETIREKKRFTGNKRKSKKSTVPEIKSLQEN